MKLRLPSLQNPPSLRQAFAVGRDLFGAAALGAAVAMLVFSIWISFQFQKAPGIDHLANAGSGLMWMIAGVYAALWLVRSVHPAMSGKRPAAAKRRFNVAPLGAKDDARAEQSENAWVGAHAGWPRRRL